MDALLREGAMVVGIGRDKSKVTHLLNSYPDDKLCFVHLDLSLVDKIEANFEKEIIPKAKFDGLILCAGKEETLPLSLCKIDKITSLFNINVFACIEILRIFSKKMVSNDGGSIIFLSSVMAELGEAGKIGYCATKSALLGVVRSSALELLKRNIRVNAIAPAIVNTPLTTKLFSGLSDENITEIEKMHPMGFGETSDVVPMIKFLLSDQSRWITGQNIKIDGGYSIK
ncbi:3-oxoacyl-[acyl-carrier-protein] reductase FabG [compost metagenome]